MCVLVLEFSGNFQLCPENRALSPFFFGSSEAMKLKRQEELLRASEATASGKRCQWRVTVVTVG